METIKDKIGKDESRVLNRILNVHSKHAAVCVCERLVLSIQCDMRAGEM